MIGNELPAVGSDITIKYRIDATKDPVDSLWRVMGYNASIPQFVKYKNGNSKIFVPTTEFDGGLLTAITVNTTKAYSGNSFGGNIVGVVQGKSENEFTYGQTNDAWGITATENGAWSVPMSVTVNGMEYTFAGYNMTIGCKSFIGSKFFGVMGHFSEFNFANTNDWSQSTIRNKRFPFIFNLLTEHTLRKSIIPVVNRTFVHNSHLEGKTLETVSDTVHLEHVVDKIWLPGCGNLNCTGLAGGTRWVYDSIYDTSIFSGVFRDRNDLNVSSPYRVFNSMGEDGNPTADGAWLWTRSADLGNGSNVLHIRNEGFLMTIQQANTSDFGMVPFFSIG